MVNREWLLQLEVLPVRREISKVNDEYKNAGTADFITGVMKKHEKRPDL